MYDKKRGLGAVFICLSTLQWFSRLLKKWGENKSKRVVRQLKWNKRSRRSVAGAYWGITLGNWIQKRGLADENIKVEWRRRKNLGYKRWRPRRK